MKVLPEFHLEMMQVFNRAFFVIVITILCSVSAKASSVHELIVESTGIGSLDSVIYADTLPNGDRADLDRVYVLRRSTKYILSQMIQWSGFDLRIKAEEGSGVRPLITFSGDQIFWLDENANLYLDGMHVNGRTDDLNVAVRIIRLFGFKDRVVVNDCILEEASQSIFRLNADSIKVFVTNSIFNRMGNPTDPNNGRLFDNRGHPIDTLMMYNSIAYDATSRFYRDAYPGTLINAIFDHNTFYASGQYGLTFGMVENLTFKNNIVANVVFLGETMIDPRFGISIDTFIPGETVIDISHNNFFVSQDFDTLLPDQRFSGAQVNSIDGDFFNHHAITAINFVGSASTNITEVLSFKDAPNVPSQFIAASAEEFYANAGTWDFSDLTPFPTYPEPGIDRYTVFHDFSYPDTTMSYTGATDGQPLGAHLNFCNYPTKLELSLDTLVNGTYTALDTLVLMGTNLIADSLTFLSGDIIEVSPTVEAQSGKEVLLITDALLCDEFVKWE